MSTVETASPYVMQKGASPTHLRMRFKPATGHGADPGIYEPHAPWFHGMAMDDRGVVCDIERDVGTMQMIIREIFFDDVALIAKADNELVDAVGRKAAHDMPQNGLTADLHHRFWP